MWSFWELTGFGNGQQSSRGQLAGSTAIPEADFSPLHTGAQGGLDTFLFEKSEQPLIMLEQSPSEIPDLAMGTI
jgi:hypothetical protein